MEFNHISVLLYETIENLNINPSGIYVDATAGGGGHSAKILEKLKDGKLICIDQDPDAIKTLENRFRDNENVIIKKGNFSMIKALLSEEGINEVDGVLMDIGVSSYQLDTKERGFSFHEDAILDMRMSKEGTSAKDLVNNLSFEELRKIISEYGEEKYASSIARGIVNEREKAPINTTLQLAEIIKENVPQKVRKANHPARKTFQALRIAVNDEFGVLKTCIHDSFDVLSKKGRLAVISFHSLEDRIVKQEMASFCQGCTCPKDFPVCVCGKTPKAKLVNKKPIVASEEELSKNPRSRSAKLRVLEKL